MKLTVNGQPREIPDPATITDLLRHLDIQAERVAVMHNDEVVRRADHPSRALHDGDRVEVITMVGGG